MLKVSERRFLFCQGYGASGGDDTGYGSKKAYGGDGGGDDTGYGSRPAYGGNDDTGYGSKPAYGGDDDTGYGAKETYGGDDTGDDYGAKKTSTGDDDGYGQVSSTYPILLHAMSGFVENAGFVRHRALSSSAY